MSTRYIVFKPTEIENSLRGNGANMQSQRFIRFDGDFSGTRRVVSSITIDYETLSSYLNTESNPGTPYVPQYPGSPATKKYVDDNIPTKVSDLTNDSDFQTSTQVNQAISTAVSSAYKYKGSVANQAALPASGNTTGDVWNTEDTGMNYAWTGSAWDALGTIVDLSGKQDKLIAGSNIQIASDGKTISATDTKYTAGNGININSNNEISANTTVLATKTDLNSKQDTISDLAAIRSGAGLGATAVQPGDNISDLNNDSGFITNSYHDSTKQDTLVSGTNIKTVNNQSLLGSGNISINGILSGAIIPPASATYTGKIWFDTMNNKFWGCDGTTWTEITPVLSVNGGTGSITVNDVKVSTTTPSSPTEGMIWYDTTNNVLNVYDGTQWNTIDTNTTYTAGDNIQISSSNVISATDTTYEAGTGIELGAAHSDMQGPAPDGFHVPSRNEWIDLFETLITTFSMARDATTIGTYLKMPLAGNRNYSSSNVGGQGSIGYYWSSTPYSTNRAYYLEAYSSSLYRQNMGARGYAHSVRCFKDTPVAPDSSWAMLYDGSSIATGAGVYYNSTLGLISVSGDGQSWLTIADKNLGATTVYNNGDTLSETNCGYYYKRGNNYGFPFTGSVTTSSTQIDASGYGPGNYYNSSTFITVNDWSSVQNDNLWGGVSQGTWVGGDGNIIVNTGVLSVNGQTGNVTIEEPIEYNAGTGINIDANNTISFGGLTILSYGNSTWQDFLDAYNNNSVVYCRASSNSNPGTGNQGRMAFMAFVTISGSTPTSVEFQYYRSRSDHKSQANQLDQVFVYTLTSTNGGTWSVAERNTATKLGAGTGLSLTYDNAGNMTMDNTAPVPTVGTNGQVLTVVNGNPAWANASGGDVLVSSQPNNILQSGMKIRAGTEGDYGSLGVYDNNTVYLTVPGAATPGRHPGANTIAYYPLETDADDYSGNSRNATNNGATFTTEGGVDCASFSDGSTKISLPALGTLTTLTVSVWFKTININPDSVILQIAPSTDDENFVLGCKNGTGTLSRYTGTSYNITDGNVSDGTWHNMVGTYTSSGGAKLYVDGVHIGDDSTATAVSGDLGYSFIGGHQSGQSGFAYIGYISNVILEDKEWTSTEVSDYYDETKGDYGIS